MIRFNSEGVWCRAQRPLGILDENGERWVRIALPLPDDDQRAEVTALIAELAARAAKQGEA